MAAERLASSGALAGALAAAAALAAAPAVQAQTPGADRLDSLHQALHLTQAQEPAWQAWRAAADPGAAQQRRLAAQRLFPTLTAPRRLDLVAAEMRSELGELQRQSAALAALYSALGPDQQKLFDAQTLPPAPAQ